MTDYPHLLCNLSNDMALATDAVPYFPPQHIRQMEDDLAMLAHVWDDGSERPQPWGWSRAAKAVFRRRGIDVRLMPSDDELARWRQYSSRAFAAAYVQQPLLPTDDGVMDVGRRMRFCRSVDEVPTTFACPMIFKSPWSSSGRGIFVADTMTADVQRRLQGFVHRQGGFLMDEYYDKRLDFALEYRMTQSGDAEFVGYSVFMAEANGNYGYNVVDDQRCLRAMIEAEWGGDIAALCNAHRQRLQQMLGGRYRGFVGIDMMVVELPSGMRAVHPCVEINLRMNMGILALLLEQKADDRQFYQRLRDRLVLEDFPFDDFDCLRSCMRSSMRVPLTPSRDVGFQASLTSGKLMITCS